jgi:hypothetical protein
MRKVRENAASTNVNIAANAIIKDVFAIHAGRRRCANWVAATHLGRSKSRCADSESRFLAINKFSRQPAWRLIGARQNRIFERIAAADSQGHFFAARDAPTFMVNDRCTLRCVKRDRGDAAVVAPRARSDAELGLQEVVDRLRVGLAAG